MTTEVALITPQMAHSHYHTARPWILDTADQFTFHRHEGNFTVVFNDGEEAAVSGTNGVMENENVRRVPALQRAIEFYKLACTPIFDDAGKPCTDSYQATMLEWGIQKLDEMRMRMPHAGGLVIAHNIEMANYMADLLAIIEGERPFVVHNQITRADRRSKHLKQVQTAGWSLSVWCQKGSIFQDFAC